MDHSPEFLRYDIIRMMLAIHQGFAGASTVRRQLSSSLCNLPDTPCEISHLKNCCLHPLRAENSFLALAIELVQTLYRLSLEISLEGSESFDFPLNSPQPILIQTALMRLSSRVPINCLKIL